MNKQSKEILFEKTPIPKAIATLSVPTVAACLVMILYNLADTFFVGKLGNAHETNAVTFAAPVLLAFNAVTNLFGTGCSSVMSRALGKKEYTTVRAAAAFGIYGALISGAVFSAAATVFSTPLLSLLGATAENGAELTRAYLFWTVTCGAIPSMLNVVLANLVRAEGSALHASIGTMSGCLLNILLDPVFIMPWGLGMGAAGAGLATFISNTVACVYFFVLLAVKKDATYVTFSAKHLKLTKPLLADVFGIGIPASVQNLLNVMGMTILNNIVSAHSASAVSATGITHKVAMVPMYVSMGIAQGIMPLVGYNYASGNRERMKKSILFTAYIAGAFMLVMTAVMIIFSEQFIRIFMDDAEIVGYGKEFLRGAAAAMPFLFFDFLAVGVFQACGMGLHSLIFALLRKIALEIPALLLLDMLFPVYGHAYAQLVAEVILAVAAFIILRRILRSATTVPSPDTAAQ